MKINEDYVTFETAKLLKENGFNAICTSEYVPDIRHNGKRISFDEELDLKDEGRGDEIEAVDGCQIWDTWNRNTDNTENVYSRPTIQLAWKWLLCEHNVEIHPFLTSLGWCFEIGDVSSLDITGSKPIYKPGFPSKDNTYDSYCSAIEAAMKWYIEHKINI